MRYLPHTQDDIQRMLRVIGVESVDELFAVIPESLRFNDKLDIPDSLSESELLQVLQQLGASNQPQGAGNIVFAGAGCHPHAIPAAVDVLSGRSEFYTAYTPYQPELSQGTLLSIFEFQTMVAELLGMEVANASMYDGASATAEGILMARRLTGRGRVIVAETLHPDYVQTCSTYLSGMEGGKESLMTTPMNSESGAIDIDALCARLDGSVASVVIQSPNFFGILEDLEPICRVAHEAGALVISVCTEPLALALMRAPGDAGADISIAEGIGLAGPPNMGGPGVGLFATRGKKALRAMPGRIVGQTMDTTGRAGYVLTLSTREQHIRREKATSNICTNHGLMALRFTIHLALLGKSGFDRLARLNLSKALYARDRICELNDYTPRFSGPFFNEFAVRVAGDDADARVEKAIARGVVPGVPLGQFFPALQDTLLISVNETHSAETIRRLVDSLKS